jgi:nitrate/nitrite-specific signal transduction histidine kinase
VSEEFLDLLYAGAPREAFDAVVLGAMSDGVTGDDLERLREHRTVALRIREQMQRQRQREAELSALYETANDLTAIRDVDAVLSAIVRRARSLLRADMTYLSLNDEAEGASYMRVTDGALTPEFRRLRLPLGTGLLGLHRPVSRNTPRTTATTSGSCTGTSSTRRSRARRSGRSWVSRSASTAP